VTTLGCSPAACVRTTARVDEPWWRAWWWRVFHTSQQGVRCGAARRGAARATRCGTPPRRPATWACLCASYCAVTIGVWVCGHCCAIGTLADGHRRRGGVEQRGVYSALPHTPLRSFLRPPPTLLLHACRPDTMSSDAWRALVGLSEIAAMTPTGGSVRSTSSPVQASRRGASLRRAAKPRHACGHSLQPHTSRRRCAGPTADAVAAAFTVSSGSGHSAPGDGAAAALPPPPAGPPLTPPPRRRSRRRRCRCRHT